MDDRKIKDEIKDIKRLNKDFSDLREILDKSQTSEEAKLGFLKLKKRFRRKARTLKGKHRNYSRMLNQMKSWEWGLFHCYADTRIPRTNNDMEMTVKRLRRDWKRTTGLVNIDEYLLFHAPYAIYLLNFRLGYLMELGIQADPYDVVKNVPKDKYLSSMDEIKERKELDVFRKKANKDINTALETIVEMNSRLGGS